VSTDTWDLERFVQAQAGVLPAVLAELAQGRKRSHWMMVVRELVESAQRRGLGSQFVVTLPLVGR
jgi:uncharacterized protein (DUF1810 family)